MSQAFCFLTMAIAQLETLNMSDQRNHHYTFSRPTVNPNMKYLQGSSRRDPSSPSNNSCHYSAEGFAQLYHHRVESMERELQRKIPFGSPSTVSPGWCSMKTPSPIPPAAQIHNLPFLEEGCHRSEGTELDFDDATMLNMMHFGLMGSEVWSHQASPRIEPSLTVSSSAGSATTGLGVGDQGQYLSHTYPSFCQTFGGSQSLSRPIFGFDQVIEPEDNPASTEEELLTWHGQPISPQSTIEPPAAFESTGITHPPRGYSPEDSSSPPPRRATSKPTTGILNSIGHMTWASSRQQPTVVPSQNVVDDDDRQDEIGDLTATCSDSTSNRPCLPVVTNRRRPSKTAIPGPDARKKVFTTTTRSQHHQRGCARRKKVGSSLKLGAEQIESGIRCEAVIAHNAFACSWPNCIDKATGKQKRFKRQEHKKRHEKTVHEKEGLYRCWVPGCTTTAFTRTDNLKSHLRNTHGKKSPNQRNRYVATQDKDSKYYDPDWQGELTEDGYPIFQRHPMGE